MRDGIVKKSEEARTLRTFLSYDIDDTIIRSSVQSMQKELVSTGADLKLVNPAILHFTVRFLGEIDEAQKEKIIRALNGHIKPLDLDVTFVGVGCFPNESRISVVWIGTDESAAKLIKEKAGEVDKWLQNAGPLHEDTHAFSPHLTIARVKSGRNRESLLNFVKARRDEEFGRYRIGPLRLKVSSLSSSGPHYTDLHVFK